MKRKETYSSGISFLILSSVIVFLNGGVFSEQEEVFSGFGLLSLLSPIIVSFFIIREKKSGAISNANLWFFVAGLGLVLTALLSKYVWVDLFLPDMLRVDDPLAVQDANKYDLSGYMLLQYGRGLGHWQSFAIDRYVYTIYYLFGVDTVNIALVNFLFRFLSVLTILKIVYECAGEKKGRDYISFLYFLPLGLYYALMPSKEVITIFCFNIFTLYVIRCAQKFSFKNMVFLVISLMSITLIRMNLGLFCAAALFFILFFFLKKAKYKLMLLLLLILAVIPFDFIARSTMNLSLLDIIFRYDGIMELSERLDSSSSGGLSGKIKDLSISYGVFGYLAMLPLKLLVVYFSPYPLFSIDLSSIYSSFGGKGKDVVMAFYSVFATLSALFNVVFFYSIYSSLIYCIKGFSHNSKVLSYFIMFVMVIISFVYLSGFTRLRTLFEMLLFTMPFLYKFNIRADVATSFILLATALIINLLINLY